MPCGYAATALRTIEVNCGLTIQTEPSVGSFWTIAPGVPIWVPSTDTAVLCFLQVGDNPLATEITEHVHGSMHVQSLEQVQAMVVATLSCGRLSALQRAAPNDVLGARLLRISQLSVHLIGLIWRVRRFHWSPPAEFELRDDHLTFTPSPFAHYDSGTMSRNVLDVSDWTDEHVVHGELPIASETIDVAAGLKVREEALVAASTEFDQRYAKTELYNSRDA